MGKTHIVEPRHYQVPVIKAVHDGLTKNRRALMRMATGTGKTFTSAFTIRNLFESGELVKSDRILVLCHKTDILDHDMEEFKQLFPDSTFGVMTGAEKKSIQANFLFATFQTLENRLSVFERDAFALILVDESHHSAAPTYRKTLNYFTPSFWLGMTATPDRMDGEDIREIFGEEVAPLTLAEAMAHGYVCPVEYKLLSVDVTRKELQRLRKELDEGLRLTRAELNRRLFTEARDVAIAEIVNTLQGQCIVFCQNIAQAETFARLLDEALPYHSDLGRSDQVYCYSAFMKGEARALAVVDAFNEGVNIPNAEHLIFLRSTDSKTIFLQQLGRGLRTAPGKELVTVHDFVGNVERIEMLRELSEEIRVVIKATRTTNDGEQKTRALNLFETYSATVLFDLHESVMDIVELLRRIETPFYPTIEEFIVVVRGLAINNSTHYLREYKRDTRLPRNPARFYANKGWPGWKNILGTKYETYEEFVAAVRRLGIRTRAEYTRRYKEDPKLHSSPVEFYANKGWRGWKYVWSDEYEHPYETYEEFVAAVRRLGIRTSTEYPIRYREDPRLHSSPDKFYANKGWRGWKDALGIKPYETYEEFVAAVRRLGIKSGTQYSSDYIRDPRLHSSPDKFYANKGWRGWKYVWNDRHKPRYETYEEFVIAVRKLGIRTSDEYLKKYKQDSRLPSSPVTFYANKGWNGWPAVWRALDQNT